MGQGLSQESRTPLQVGKLRAVMGNDGAKMHVGGDHTEKRWLIVGQFKCDSRLRLPSWPPWNRALQNVRQLRSCPVHNWL